MMIESSTTRAAVSRAAPIFEPADITAVRFHKRSSPTLVTGQIVAPH